MYSFLGVSRTPHPSFSDYAYLIFIINITKYTYLETKSVMWRNFRFLNMTDVEKSEVSPHVEHFQIYPHDRGVEISNLSTYVMCVMWRMSPHRLSNWFCFNLRCFVAVYAVLSRNMFFFHDS